MEFLVNNALFEVKSPALLAALVFAAFLIRSVVRRVRNRAAQKNDKVIAPDKVTVPGAIYELRVSGPILTEKGSVPALPGAVTFGSVIGGQLEKVAANQKIVAVVIYWNTPGGTVVGSESIRQGILACKKAGKKVFSHGLDLVASGGMWGISASDHVSVDEGALIGSIGVVGPTLFHYDDVTGFGSGLFGSRVQGRVTARVLSSGKGKALGNPFERIDEEVVKNFTATLDRMRERFIDVVLEGRGGKVSREGIETIGAQVVDAWRALDLGLVDSIQSASSVRGGVAKALGKLEKECTFILAPPAARQGIFEKILGAHTRVRVTEVDEAIRLQLSRAPMSVVLRTYLQ